MQLAVNLGDRNVSWQSEGEIGGAPEGFELPVTHPAAFPAGTMPGRQRRGFVEKEKL